jgi:predicted MFS family arabinose efflux permease
MGITAAAGSFGQFLMVPVEGYLITTFGWQQALTLLGFAALLMVPFAWGLREPGFGGAQHTPREQTIVQALKEAFKYPSFQLLMAGYFVCGFQVVFIGVHMPSYLKDKGLSPQVASYALALIGLFNVFGTYAAGVLGQRLAKRKILAFIYLARSVAIGLFLVVPLSPASVYVFASVMGLLWLSTVPVTNATVAQIFGVAHLSMLSGFVFFSHQIGSFMGVWLGGYLYDRTGSYDVVWYIAIALGVLAAMVNLPIKEMAIARPAPAGAH